VSFSSDTNTGIYRPADDIIGMACGGGDAMRVASTGISFDGGTSYHQLRRVTQANGEAFVPMLYGGTTAGTPTYTTQTCDYMILGDVVIMVTRIELSAKTGIVGEVRVSQPFFNDSDAVHARVMDPDQFTNWTGLTAGRLNKTQFLNNVNYVRFIQRELSTTTGNGPDTVLTDANLTATTSLRFWTMIMVNH
jgi:hypothetical protein